MNIRSALENTIPISQFNRGLAGKIFEEVKRYGAKVVMKNNIPECVLLSPEEYIRLLDEANDARLLATAAQRMSQFNPSTAIIRLTTKSYRWLKSPGYAFSASSKTFL